MHLQSSLPSSSSLLSNETIAAQMQNITATTFKSVAKEPGKRRPTIRNKYVEKIEKQQTNVSLPQFNEPSLFNLTSENIAMKTIEQDDNLTISNLPRPLNTNVNLTQTTLILAPSGNAVAGNLGRASSETYSRAILRSNSNVRLLYKPESVAVAGIGGVAHAQSELDIWIM